MTLKVAELTSLLQDRIVDFKSRLQSVEVGRVIDVGDGVARIYGLDKAQAGEMLEFSDGTLGMTLNLEEDNVGAVIFGDDFKISEVISLSELDVLWSALLVRVF